MAKNQRDKITELESQLQLYKEREEQLYQEILKLQENADILFKQSPYFHQLNDENMRLKEENKVLRTRLEYASKKNDNQTQLLQKLQPNNRNAGRKPKLTDDQVNEVLQLRKAGMTIKSIADQLHCSCGLVHKLIHERNCTT